MRVANWAIGSSGFAMRGLCRLLLRSRWTPRTTPTPATAANGLRLRGHVRRRALLLCHLLGDGLRWPTGTTGAPLPARLATATTVLRRLSSRDASEERPDGVPHFLLHQVPDHRH